MRVVASLNPTFLRPSVWCLIQTDGQRNWRRSWFRRTRLHMLTLTKQRPPTSEQRADEANPSHLSLTVSLESCREPRRGKTSPLSSSPRSWRPGSTCTFIFPLSLSLYDSVCIYVFFLTMPLMRSANVI